MGKVGERRSRLGNKEKKSVLVLYFLSDPPTLPPTTTPHLALPDGGGIVCVFAVPLCNDRERFFAITIYGGSDYNCFPQLNS